ncbi:MULTISPECIES: hypothetical protein [unclassified Dehalobacter]|uniref:hypothetical protein n=1 Tax=unclassified Dehalobacter TaxID=2635733 RepID=UPI001872CCE9|nr:MULTISPECIES: hypothetical protein [unclassified Dehalobacter]
MEPSGTKIYDFRMFHAKKRSKCIFCNGTDQLLLFKRQTVCPDCLNSIRKLYETGHFNPAG